MAEEMKMEQTSDDVAPAAEEPAKEEKKSAVEMLREEIEENKDDLSMVRIADYIMPFVLRGGPAAIKFGTEEKSLAKCMDDIRKRAYQFSKGQRSTCVLDAVVYGWVREYYGIKEEKPKSKFDLDSLLG